MNHRLVSRTPGAMFIRRKNRNPMLPPFILSKPVLCRKLHDPVTVPV